jgi:hypothetical protein
MVACATFVGVAPSGSFSASAFLGAQLLRATARPPALAWSLVACCAAEEMAAYTERIVSPAHRPVLPAANSAHAVTETCWPLAPRNGRSAENEARCWRVQEGAQARPTRHVRGRAVGGIHFLCSPSVTRGRKQQARVLFMLVRL